MSQFCFERFSGFDPLLLLPESPGQGAVVGAKRDWDDHFRTHRRDLVALDHLDSAGPLLDTLVVLDTEETLGELLKSARDRLRPGGTLLARVPNGALSPRLAMRLYQSLEAVAPNGVTLETLYRELAAAGFVDVRVFAWIPSETLPYALFPVDDRRMMRFFLNGLLPRQNLRRLIASLLSARLHPRVIAPYFYCLGHRRA